MNSNRYQITNGMIFQHVRINQQKLPWISGDPQLNLYIYTVIHVWYVIHTLVWVSHVITQTLNKEEEKRNKNKMICVAM
jgi:hypothetical protein